MGEYHGPMSEYEFLRLPRHLGWRYHHAGDYTRVWPAHVYATVVLDLQPLPPVVGIAIRPLERSDRQHLPPLYALSMRPEDVGPAEETDPLDWARACLDDFFQDDEHPPLPCSCVAIDTAGFLGAALVAHAGKGPVLDTIMAHPQARRRGVATALLEHVVARLLTEGETRLFSRYSVGNESAVAWHTRNGFQELPDLTVAGHRATVYGAELERRKRLGAVSEAELSRLATRWQEEFDCLRSLAGPDRWCPLVEVDASCD